MGEIAEDMIDGTACQWCGLYFQKDGEIFIHGYPVVCHGCFKDYYQTTKQVSRQQFFNHFGYKVSGVAVL